MDDIRDWENYHEEHKYAIWERHCEWWTEWDSDMGSLLRVVRAADTWVREWGRITIDGERPAKVNDLQEALEALPEHLRGE